MSPDRPVPMWHGRCERRVMPPASPRSPEQMTSDVQARRSAERASAAGSLHVRQNVRVPKPLAFVAVLAILWPGAAHAQFGYPRPYPPQYGYRYVGPDSSLRISVTPKQAAVYVDGYFAG